MIIAHFQTISPRNIIFSQINVKIMLVIIFMIVKNLRYCRENLELKQKEIAEILGVTYSTVSGWETGKDTIPLKQLIEFANKFNLSLDYLFGLNNTYE